MTPTASPSIEVLFAEVYHNRGKLVVFRQQLNRITLLFRRLTVTSSSMRATTTAVTHVLRFMYRKQIAVKNTDVFHGHTAYAQQEIRARRTCRDQHGSGLQYAVAPAEVHLPRRAPPAECPSLLPPAGGYRVKHPIQSHYAFTRQRFQVFLGSVRRTEAQTLRDFRVGGIPVWPI